MHTHEYKQSFADTLSTSQQRIVPSCPPKLAHSTGLWIPPYSMWFLGSTRVYTLQSVHLDRFSRFCTANTQTITSLRATSTAVGRIYAQRAGDAA